MVGQPWANVNTILSFEDKTDKADGFSYRFHVEYLRAIKHTGLSGNLVLTGLTTLSHRPQNTEAVSLIPGMFAVNASDEDIAQTILSSSSKKNVFLQLAQITVEQMLAFYQQAGTRGIVFLLLDVLTIPEFEDSLWLLKNALPQQCLVLITTLPASDQRRPALAEVGEKLISLHKQGVLTTTLLLDVHSPAAGVRGFVQQEQLLAQSLAKLLLLHCHDEHNPTPEQVFCRIGQLSAFTGLAVGSAPLSAGVPEKNWEMVRKLFPHFPQKGEGNVSEAIAKAKNLTRFVLTEQAACTSQIVPDVTQPCFLLYSLPVRHADERFAVFANEMRRFCVDEFPMGCALCVRGNGTPIAKQNTGYALQTAAFYPLAPSLFTSIHPKLPVLEIEK